MTGSLIHTAFDPQPYIVFSACAIAIGVLLEVNSTGDALRRCIDHFRRKAALPALHAGDASRLHSLGIAKH